MISLLVPTRGRPEGFARFAHSVLDTATEDVQIVARLDLDDPTGADYPILDRVDYVVQARTVLSQCWNDCVPYARGEVLMHAGDDLVFQTPGWDLEAAAAFPADGIAFVHGDDLGGKGDWFGTHGLIRREWVDAVGYFVPPLFSSDYNDTWLNDVANMLQRRIFVPFVTEHMHPAFGKGEWDQTHQERLARGREDGVDKLYRETAHLRYRDAKALEAVMR